VLDLPGAAVVVTAAHGAHTALGHMRRLGGGVIVNVASLYA
jgi:hypothetical protein